MKSTTKVWTVLAVISLLMIVVGDKLGDRLGLFLGFISATIFSYLIIISGRTSILKKFGAKEVLGQDSWNLKARVAYWAHHLALPQPKVYLLPTNSAVAFSTTHLGGMSSLCLSEGLFEKLTPEEVEAVMVYQLCQLHHMDQPSFGVATMIASALITLADILDQLWLLKKLPKLERLRPFHLLLGPIAWVFLRLKIRETNYFQNDDMAAQVLPDRKVLARALWKLESLSQARPMVVPDCSSHLFMVNPRGLRAGHWFYQTHPKINTRVLRMIGYEPI